MTDETVYWEDLITWRSRRVVIGRAGFPYRVFHWRYTIRRVGNFQVLKSIVNPSERKKKERNLSVTKFVENYPINDKIAIG